MESESSTVTLPPPETSDIVASLFDVLALLGIKSVIASTLDCVAKPETSGISESVASLFDVLAFSGITDLIESISESISETSLSSVSTRFSKSLELPPPETSTKPKSESKQIVFLISVTIISISLLFFCVIMFLSIISSGFSLVSVFVFVSVCVISELSVFSESETKLESS